MKSETFGQIRIEIIQNQRKGEEETEKPADRIGMSNGEKCSIRIQFDVTMNGQHHQDEHAEATGKVRRETFDLTVGRHAMPMAGEQLN